MKYSLLGLVIGLTMQLGIDQASSTLGGDGDESQGVVYLEDRAFMSLIWAIGDAETEADPRILISTCSARLDETGQRASEDRRGKHDEQGAEGRQGEDGFGFWASCLAY